MIGTRYLYAALFLASILAVILVLIATGMIPPSKGASVNSTSVAPDELVEPVAGQVAAVEPRDSTGEQGASQAASSEEALALLESHCAQCHAIRLLKGTKKPRTEWEKTLLQMEAFGVSLGSTEKVILIDYLSSNGKP